MTSTGIGDAYDRGATGWQTGPEAVYARLADALVSTAPIAMRGARVLDAGAGTAVASLAALSRGAHVVAADISVGMLDHRDQRVAAVCADVARLPFRDNIFELVIAAFCLGHVGDPSLALKEMHRVGSALVASAFAPGWSHPAKTIVDEVMSGVGFVTPAWYARVKEDLEPTINDPAALSRLARTAGFDEVNVQRIDVDSGLSSPADIVNWRLGMAHLAPYVATLPPDVLQAARNQAETAVAGVGPVVIPILALSAS